ncbi:MAG: aldehyde dehydrogenase family protein, partial [bacterium]|nr:aldehyde dehydrogenase family protein [bacterium]
MSDSSMPGERAALDHAGHVYDRHFKNYVGGEVRPAAGGAELEVWDPARNQRIAYIPRSTAADVADAVRAANGASAGAWGRATTAERADLLEAIAAGIEARFDEFAELESL